MQLEGCLQESLQLLIQDDVVFSMKLRVIHIVMDAHPVEAALCPLGKQIR